MALAPLAYVLWQRFLRFDPQDPIWPNRDRFVLSTGHASMLLYSLLHLTGVRAVDPDYEIEGDAGGQPRGHQALPPARLQMPGAPRVPLDLRASRPPPARSARGSRPRRDGGRLEVAGRQLQPPRRRAVRLRRLRDRRRRLPDGGGLERGRLVRRPPEASTTSAGSTTTTTSRSTGTPTITYEDDVAGALRGLRLERDRGSSDANNLDQIARRVRQLQAGAGAADADHRRLPHRLRLAAQGGHRGGPRRAARRGGGARDQARLRLARGRRSSSFPTASRSTSPRGSASAARSCAASGRALRELPRRRAREGRPLGGDAAPRAARGLGRRHPELRARREGHGDAQGLEQGRERGRGAGSHGCSRAPPT